jgi:phosphoserine aminotransferase
MPDFITFNPGPSQISPEVKADISSAVNKGILEISHRSTEFSAISAKTVRGLREFFGIPRDYRIFYASSATEAMLWTIANGVESRSFHFVNGSFSKKYADISASMGKTIECDAVSPGEQNDITRAHISPETELVTVTGNETSTGAFVPPEHIAALSKRLPEATLLAVDATSMAGGIEIDICAADIWLFSVQKCLGLPSGLGIVFVSPKAYEKSLSLEQRGKNLGSIFSYSRLAKKMDNAFQTVQTPNMLGIFLLGEQMERWNSAGGMATKDAETREKARVVSEVFAESRDIDFFVSEPPFRSPTVICLKAAPEVVTRLHEKTRAENILLGKGYGEKKAVTFRIANFPAHTQEIMERLIGVLKK